MLLRGAWKPWIYLFDSQVDAGLDLGGLMDAFLILLFYEVHLVAFDVPVSQIEFDRLLPRSVRAFFLYCTFFSSVCGANSLV